MVLVPVVETSETKVLLSGLGADGKNLWDKDTPSRLQRVDLL